MKFFNYHLIVRPFTLATAILITLGALAGTVNAATLSTTAEVRGPSSVCGVVTDTGTTSASASCTGVPGNFPAQIDISSSAIAVFGSLGVGIDTLLTTEDNVPGDNIGGQISAQGNARAIFEDTLTVTNGPASGILQFEFDLSGTTNFDVVPGNSAPPGLGSAFTLLSLSVNKTFQQNNTPFRIFTTLSGTTQTGSLVFNLNYSGGQTGLYVQMFGNASCGGLVNRSSEYCIISHDYLGASTLLGTTVLDENMEEVPGATIISDSGFDYQPDTITDSDGDGVVDGSDVCEDTVIPEDVPTQGLGVNRWTLMNGDGIFDTTLPRGGGKGPQLGFAIEDTAGCSCAQIISALDLGKGHEKHGCSISAMEDFVELVNP